MDADAFVQELLTKVPEAGLVLDQHLRDNDELLLHLFVGDLRLTCEAAWSAGNHEVLSRVLTFLDVALSHGDDYVENAVAVSFVEDSEWWEPRLQNYIAIWPPALTAEVERQRAARG